MAFIADCLLGALEVERFALRLVLLALVVHCLRRAFARRLPPLASPPSPVRLPRATILLPVVAGGAGARAALDAALDQRYPAALLDCFVLDDTASGLSPAQLDELLDGRDRSRVRVLRRPVRSGGKAGNLMFGLAHTTAELVVPIDEDTLVPPAFVREAAGVLVAEPDVALVQGRLKFSRAGDSGFKRAQRMLFASQVNLENPELMRRRQLVHANGAAGVWRRSALDRMGGWQPEALAEDADLGFRVAFAGQRVLQLDDLRVETDVAGTMAEFKRQQTRWMAGRARILRDHFGQLLAGSLAPVARLSLLGMVAGRALHAFLAILTITTPLTTFDVLPVTIGYSGWANASLVALVLASLFLYFRRGSEGGLREAASTFPLAIALMIGMSFHYTAALLRGLFGARLRFETTRADATARAIGLVEIAAALYLLGAMGLALHGGRFDMAAFFAWFGTAYAWVAVKDLWPAARIPATASAPTAKPTSWRYSTPMRRRSAGVARERRARP